MYSRQKIIGTGEVQHARPEGPFATWKTRQLTALKLRKLEQIEKLEPFLACSYEFEGL